MLAFKEAVFLVERRGRRAAVCRQGDAGQASPYDILLRFLQQGGPEALPLAFRADKQFLDHQLAVVPPYLFPAEHRGGHPALMLQHKARKLLRPKEIHQVPDGGVMIHLHCHSSLL